MKFLGSGASALMTSSVLLAVLLVAGCAHRSGHEESTRVDDTPIGTATWYLVPPAMMDDISWDFGSGSGRGRPPSHQFQVHVLDDLEVGAIQRAGSKLEWPMFTTPVKKDPQSRSFEWSIPVQRTFTRVRLSATPSTDGKYYDVRLLVDGRPVRRKVPGDGFGFLFVLGFPSNASLVGLIPMR